MQEDNFLYIEKRQTPFRMSALGLTYLIYILFIS